MISHIRQVSTIKRFLVRMATAITGKNDQLIIAVLKLKPGNSPKA